MLMHLSLGVAAKVGGLEECRSRADLQSRKSRSRAGHADMRIAQSCKSRSRGAQSCGPAQPRIPRGRVARIARPLTCARPLTHMLPVSLKMPLLPSPSPRLLPSLDELEPSLSDSLLDPPLDPDPEPFELPGIMRP